MLETRSGPGSLLRTGEDLPATAAFQTRSMGVRAFAILSVLLILHGAAAVKVQIDFNIGVSQKYEGQSVTVSHEDEVDFIWTGDHNVYLLKDKTAFDTCNFDGSTLVGDTSGKAKKTVRGKNGTRYYFACKVGSHCQTGQKLEVLINGTPCASCMSAAITVSLQSLCVAMQSSACWRPCD